jgi:F420 biosynthesis protein FbiB-like protein
MNTLEAIAARRSIRKFKSDPIPEDVFRKILTAGIQAPSGKNRQPWKFIVVQGEQKAELIRLMYKGIEHMKAEGMEVGSSEWTTKVMEQAPVTIIVYNPYGIHPWEKHTVDQSFDDLVNVQSIGAAIQNMLLAAQDLGLGSLWICDVFFAYEELMNWLGETCQLVAAVSLGYPDECPNARPRKSIDEVVRWI